MDFKKNKEKWFEPLLPGLDIFAPEIENEKPDFKYSIQTLKKNGTVDKENLYTNYSLLLQMEDINELMSFPFRKFNVRIDEQFGHKRIVISEKHFLIKDFDKETPMEALIMPVSSSSLITNIFDTYKMLLNAIYANVHVEKNMFYILVDRNILEEMTMYTVIFRPLRIPMRYQRRALKLLKANREMLQYIFPTETTLSKIPDATLFETKPFQYFNETIASNPEQVEAIQTIVHNLHAYAPYIIFGPPGTGKTATIVEAVLQLLIANETNRIYITAGSNSACDNIAMRLNEVKNSHANLTNKQILRVYSDGRKIPDDEIPFASLCVTQYRDTIRSFYRVIISTLCVGGSILAEDDCFTHMFIDEVAASTEPETFIPLGHIKFQNFCKPHVIIAGDHKQLGPVIKCQTAAKYGLAQSLMDRLLANKCYEVNPISGAYCHRLQVRLIQNYRSHPEIVRIYNHLYYDDKLVAMIKEENFIQFNNWQILENKNFPIIFQAACDPSKRRGTSYINELEVDSIEWYLCSLLYDHNSSSRIADRIQPTDIGIITPYKAQQYLIKKLLIANRWTDVELGSVENFQGREKTIIIVSLVRSQTSLGFLVNPRRLNVMLSRPKSLLIIIGNTCTFKHNKDYAYIIEECEKMGTLRTTPNVIERSENWRKNRTVNIDLAAMIKDRLKLQ